VIRLSMTLGIFQGHWTVSHRISQKRCVIWQKLLYTTNRKSYTSFRLVPLLMCDTEHIFASLQLKPSPSTSISQSLQYAITLVSARRRLLPSGDILTLNSSVICRAVNFTSCSTPTNTDLHWQGLDRMASNMPPDCSPLVNLTE